MQALRKDPLTVYGDGKQTRSFQFVSDLVYFFNATFLHVQIFIDFFFGQHYPLHWKIHIFKCTIENNWMFNMDDEAVHMTIGRGLDAADGRWACWAFQSWQSWWIHHAWTCSGTIFFCISLQPLNLHLWDYLIIKLKFHRSIYTMHMI